MKTQAQNPRTFAQSMIESSAFYYMMVTTAFALCVLISFSVVANNDIDPVLEKLTVSAMEDMHQNNYNGALEKLITVYGHAPMTSIDHLLGVCYYNLNNMEQAELHLSNAIEDLTEENTEWDVFNGQAPQHALHYLGLVHMAQQNYGDAMMYFSNFLVGIEMMDIKEDWMIEMTQEAISICLDNDQPAISAAR